MFMFRGARNVLWKSHVLAQPSRTLCASDRSRCGTIRILALLAQPSQHFVRVGSLSLWRGHDFSWFSWILGTRSHGFAGMSFYDALAGVSWCIILHNIGRSWPRSRNEILSDVLSWSCTGPYQKMLWRSCWHPLRGSCMILCRPLWENLVESLINSL